MKPIHSAFAISLALVLLAGCAYLGVPQPQTFNERVAYAYAGLASARDTATSLVQGDKITVEDARNVQTQADAVREGVDVARAIHSSNPQAGAERLDLAISSLTAIQKYLESRK